MTEVEKKGTGKAKVALVVCVVLVVILAVSNVWFFMRAESFGNQINDLETDKSNLQSQVNSLQNEVNSLEIGNSNLESQINNLLDQISDLEYQNTVLQNEVDSLKLPQLHTVEVYWTDKHPLTGSPYINIYGSIFNSGSQTASSVVLTVKVYDVYDTLLKSEEIHLGTIAGRSYKSFDVDIEYSGVADHVITTLTYS